MKTTRFVTISVQEVADLISDYVTLTSEDDDSMIEARKYLDSIPYIDQVIFVLHSEKYSFNVIAHYLNVGYSFVFNHYHVVLCHLRRIYSHTA